MVFSIVGHPIFWARTTTSLEIRKKRIQITSEQRKRPYRRATTYKTKRKFSVIYYFIGVEYASLKILFAMASNISNEKIMEGRKRIAYSCVSFKFNSSLLILLLMYNLPCR